MERSAGVFAIKNLIFLWMNLSGLLQRYFPRYWRKKRLGIPTPIGIEGRIYFIMPDGRILREEELESEEERK